MASLEAQLKVSGSDVTYSYDYGTEINWSSITPANGVAQIADDDTQHHQTKHETN